MKKIISYIIVVSLILSAFTVYGAEEKTVDAVDSIVSFLDDLGITEGIDFSDLSREVKRGEFIAMTMRMQNMDYPGRAGAEFTDVTSKTPFANEIYAAKEMGIINGVTPTEFGADNTISFGAALKVTTAFLGFGDLALVSGGYPTGYLTVASSLGLTKGVSTNDKLTLSAAIRLIYNALNTDINSMVGVSEGSVSSAQIKGRNPLREYFGLECVDGIVQTAGYHSMLSEYYGGEERILINGVNLYCNLEDSEKYLGYDVSCWYDEETNHAKALFVKRNNKTITLDAEYVTSYSDFEISYDNGGKALAIYNLDKGFSFVLNGRCIAPVKEDFLFDNGSFLLIDNDIDGDWDVVSATKNEYFVVSGRNEYYSAVYDKNIASSELVLCNTDKSRFELYKETDGILQSAEFDDVKVGDVFTVNRSRDGFLNYIIMGNESIKGTIEECGENSVKIDGTEYKVNEYFAKYYEYSVGLVAEFKMASDGTICAIAGSEAEEMQYGYFLDYFKKEGTIAGVVEVKIRDANNKLITAELADKVILDGSTPMVKTSNDIKEALMNGEYPRYQLIRFAFDKDGKIKTIDTSEKASGKNITEKYEVKSAGENTLTQYLEKTTIYYRDQGMAVPYFTFAGTLVFRVPSALSKADAVPQRYSDELFVVGSTSHLSNGSKPVTDAFDYNENFAASVAVLYDKVASNSGANRETPGSESTAHVVEKVVDGLDYEGIKTKVIYTYAKGQFSSYAVSTEVLGELTDEGKIPASGDVVRFSFNGNGEINGIARDVILGSDGKLTISYGSDSLSTSAVNVNTYMAGKAFSVSGTSVVVRADEGTYPTSPGHSDRIDGLSSHITSGTLHIVIYNKDTGYIELGKMSDINTEVLHGSEYASDILLRLRYYSPNLIVIYQ